MRRREHWEAEAEEEEACRVGQTYALRGGVVEILVIGVVPVTVVSPGLVTELESWVRCGELLWVRRFSRTVRTGLREWLGEGVRVVCSAATRFGILCFDVEVCGHVVVFASE
jgi:predicted DNA repair protein MutK